jgi:hypothetical protein
MLKLGWAGGFLDTLYLSAERELIWLAPGETVPERERYMTQSPKLMAVVAWNITGFQVLATLPTGTKFNIRYYTSEILEQIRQCGRFIELEGLDN